MIDLFLNPDTVGYVCWGVAFLTPLAALAAILAFWSKQAALVRNRFFWAFAAFGPLLTALWFLFNWIEEALGLDSIVALGVNLVLFCVVGLVGGAALRVLGRKPATSEESGAPGKADSKP